MFLRATIRKKSGNEHRYFSNVENKNARWARAAAATCCIWGEINPSQNFALRRSNEVLVKGAAKSRTLAPVDGSIARSSDRSSRRCVLCGHGNGSRAGCGLSATPMGLIAVACHLA